MLSAIPYNNNDIYLHTDAAMMPVSVSVIQALATWLLYRLPRGPIGQPLALMSMFLCACAVVRYCGSQDRACVVLC